MEESPKIYHCDFAGCKYSSKHNHNVLRHKRNIHKQNRVEELDTDYEDNAKPPSVISDTIPEEPQEEEIVEEEVEDDR